MRKLSQSLGIAVVVTLMGQPAGAEGEGSAFWPGVFQAPEPNPPSLVREEAGRESTLRLAADPAPYTIGDPTDEEQLYVELVNRSRANPQAEAERLLTSTDPDIQAALKYYNVDLELVRSQYLTVRPAPPVSLHAQLTAAARGHCADMFTNVFQGHVGTDGSTIGVRITRTGY
ncbi:MAG: hypothetical protein IT580_16115, partial [Verrucomicrobiales bacterium]|nr:hypothetical protein [Verrucomicrobiales bacterium]